MSIYGDASRRSRHLLEDGWRDEIDEFHRDWVSLLAAGLIRQGMLAHEAGWEALKRVNRLRESLYDWLPPLEGPP